MKILECMQNLDMEILVQHSNMFETYMYNGNPWSVYVDNGNRDGSTHPLFKDHPSKLLREGGLVNKVAVLHGSTSDEGAFLMPQFVNEERKYLTHLAGQFDHF